MSDVIDRAQHREQLDRDLALRAQMLRSQAPPWSGNCVDCDGDIDERRRRALPQAYRCIDCALVFEARQKHARRLR